MWSELDGAARDVVDVVHGRRELGRLAQSARLARRGSLDGSMWLAQWLDGSRHGSPDSLYGSRSCLAPAHCLANHLACKMYVILAYWLVEYSSVRIEIFMHA